MNQTTTKAATAEHEAAGGRDNDICYADVGDGRYCGAFRKAHGRATSLGDHRFKGSPVLDSDPGAPRRAGAGHSRLPWSCEDKGRLMVHVQSGDGEYVCGLRLDGNGQENAAFIVQAVNNHTVLVETLDQIRVAILNHFQTEHDNHGSQAIARALDAADDALAQARRGV